MVTVANISRINLFTREVLVGLIGLIVSIILHELFHMLLHWERLQHIGLFPRHSGAIVEIDVALPPGYDLRGEEIAAYVITLIVWVVTIMIIFRMHDTADKRSAGQILFPHNKEMQKMSPSELLDLAERADPMQVGLTPDHTKDKKQRR